MTIPPIQTKACYTLLTATSIDGKIAPQAGRSTDWTSPEDKAHMTNILDQSDLVVVGRTTYELAKEPLLRRRCLIFSRAVESVWQDDAGQTWINAEVVDVLEWIRQARYSSVCLLGGRSVYNYFLQRGRLDEMWITIEPVIFGVGIPLFDCEAPLSDFELISHTKLNTVGSILLHYRSRQSPDYSSAKG